MSTTFTQNSTTANISTIFKTFNGDIDKWTAKIGVFGKSFYELGDAVNKAFKSVIDNLDNFDEDINFWDALKNNLAPKNEDGDSWLRNSLGEIISAENINSYIAELDLDSAKEKIQSIFDWESDIKRGDATWQDYFDTLDDGEGYIIDLIKNTDDLSKLTGDDLVKANKQARASAIAHNTALNQMTLGAKAANVAMQALSVAGNMLVFWAISKIPELLDKWIVTAEEAQEAMEDAVGEYASAKSELESLNSELETTNQKIDELKAKENLSLVEQEELNTLQETNRELEYKIALMEKENALKQKEAAISAAEATEKTFKGGVNEDLLNTSLEYFHSSRETDKGDYAFGFAIDEDNINSLISAYQMYNELLDDGYNESYVDILSTVEDNLVENLLLLEEQKSAMEDYYNYIKDTSPELLSNEDKGVIKFYEQIVSDIEYINKLINPELFANDTIEGILAKANFDGIEDRLISLGKNGSLSTEMLKEKFGGKGGLIDQLEQAGVSAEQLLQYIMALANPDAINYGEVKNQFLQATGVSDGIDSRRKDEITRQLSDAGMFEDDVLEAFLNVKARFGDDETKYWTVEDWIHNVQEELESANLSADVSFSDIFAMENSEGELNLLGEANQALDELQSAYTGLKEAMDSYTIFFNIVSFISYSLIVKKFDIKTLLTK